MSQRFRAAVRALATEALRERVLRLAGPDEVHGRARAPLGDASPRRPARGRRRRRRRVPQASTNQRIGTPAPAAQRPPNRMMIAVARSKRQRHCAVVSTKATSLAKTRSRWPAPSHPPASRSSRWPASRPAANERTNGRKRRRPHFGFAKRAPSETFGPAAQHRSAAGLRERSASKTIDPGPVTPPKTRDRLTAWPHPLPPRSLQARAHHPLSPPTAQRGNDTVAANPKRKSLAP